MSDWNVHLVFDSGRRQTVRAGSERQAETTAHRMVHETRGERAALAYVERYGVRRLAAQRN